MKFSKSLFGTAVVLAFSTTPMAFAQDDGSPGTSPGGTTGTNGTGTPAPSNNPSDLGSHTATQVTQDSLSGKWSSECEETSIVGKSARRILTFQGNTFEDQVTMFTDEKCGTPAAQVLQNGTFTLGQMQQGEKENFEFVPIDLNYQKGFVKPMHREALNNMNEMEFCGFKNWRVNRTKDLGEGKREDCKLREYPSTVFNTVGLDQNRLYLGEPGLFDGDEEKDNRPKNLDRDKSFAKQ